MNEHEHRDPEETRDDIELRSNPTRLIETLVDAVDQTFDSIIITDVQLDAPGPRIVYVNRAFSAMTGYTPEQLVGATPRILQGPRTDPAVLGRMRDDLVRDGSFQGRAINYRRDGTEFWMEWSISTVRGDDGAPQFYVAVQRDVTTFHRLLEDSERRARTDVLTGLANRRYFDAHLASVLADPMVDAHVGLITLDIDRFKSVNDTHGHAAGDAVLQEVARRVRDVVGERGLVARTGGEELAIVLSGAETLPVVVALAERVRLAVAASPVRAGSRSLTVTASFGTAHALVSGTSPQRMAADADHALYRSKTAGRNRVSSFTTSDAGARETTFGENASGTETRP